MTESQDQGQVAASDGTSQVEGQEQGQQQAEPPDGYVAQETVNKIVGERVKEASTKAEERARMQVAEKFGYDDPADLDAAAEALKTWEEENSDELEKRDAEIGKRDKAIAEKDETIASLTRQVRRSSFIEQIGLPNPRAAWGYVLDGTVEVEWDDNHKPSNLDAVRKALKTEDAGLFGNGSADGGRRTGSSGAPQNIHGADLIKHAYENSNS